MFLLPLTSVLKCVSNECDQLLCAHMAVSIGKLRVGTTEASPTFFQKNLIPPLFSETRPLTDC